MPPARQSGWGLKSRIFDLYFIICILFFLVIYRCSFVRQKNQKRRKPKYLPGPEPLGARPKTPCKQRFAIYSFRRNSQMLNKFICTVGVGLCSTRKSACKCFAFYNVLCSLRPKRNLCMHCVQLRRGGYYPPEKNAYKHFAFYNILYLLRPKTYF